MPPALNINAKIVCHGTGMLQLMPKQQQVMIGGAPAVRITDLVGVPIVGCPVPPPPAPTKPCTTFNATPTPGVSTSTCVMIGKQPAAMSAGVIPGITDGVPPLPVANVMFPGQMKVQINR